jgi:Cys-tRNA(Pro)/Cys-tRNA(Cys) deacylase
MTPCIEQAKQAKIYFKVHEYEHAPSAESYGLEAADKLGVDHNRVFKTLVVSLMGNALATAIIPVNKMLNMKLIAKALGAKKAQLADKLLVERSTGYVLGGVSPLGQKKALQTVIDISAFQFDTIYVSAGRRGLEIELRASDLKLLTKAVTAQLS